MLSDGTGVSFSVFNRGFVFAMGLLFFVMLLCTPLCATFSITCNEPGNCNAGYTEVDCIRGNDGTCAPSDLVSPTPHCSREFLGSDSNISLLLSLGGHSYQDVFGSTVPDFACSMLCDGLQTSDTTRCTRARACNTVSCMTEVSAANAEPRACPVYITKGQENEEKYKKDVKCQSCSECGRSQASVQNKSGWGFGCARECTQILCDDGEVYDWTDKRCKPCQDLFNTSLCGRSDVGNDVTGHLQRVQFKACNARGQVDVQYGECTACPSYTCASGLYPNATCGCSQCERLNATNRKYLDTTLYCQVASCESGKTGVFIDGRLCAQPCTSIVCNDGERRSTCMLPRDTRCVPMFPLNEQKREVDVIDASANRLETQTGPWHGWASFENILVVMDERAEYQEQCVWNSAGILDNAFEPGGVAAVFWPGGRSSNFEYKDTGTQKCRPRTTGYPLLPLQNTVSFDGDTTRRVLVNSTLRAVSYDFIALEDWEVWQTQRPIFAPDLGELLVVLDLGPRETVHMQLDIPSDRANGQWAKWWRLSLFVYDLTFNPALELITTGVRLPTEQARFPVGGVGTRIVQSSGLEGFYASFSGGGRELFLSNTDTVNYMFSNTPFIASNASFDISAQCVYVQMSACAALALGSHTDPAENQVLFNETVSNKALAVTSIASTSSGKNCLTYVGTLEGVFCVADELIKITDVIANAMVFLESSQILLIFGSTTPGTLWWTAVREQETLTVNDGPSPVFAMAPMQNEEFLVLHEYFDGGNQIKVGVEVYHLVDSASALSIVTRKRLCLVGSGLEWTSTCNMVAVGGSGSVVVACVLQTGDTTVYVCPIGTGPRQRVVLPVAAIPIDFGGFGMLSVVAIGARVVVGRNGALAMIKLSYLSLIDDGYMITDKLDVSNFPDESNTFSDAHFASSLGGFVLFRDLLYPSFVSCETGWHGFELYKLGITVPGDNVCVSPEAVSQSVVVVAWVPGVLVTPAMGGVFAKSAVPLNKEYVSWSVAQRIRHRGIEQFASYKTLTPQAVGGHGSVYMKPSHWWRQWFGILQWREVGGFWIVKGDDADDYDAYGLWVFVHDDTIRVQCYPVYIDCAKGATVVERIPQTAQISGKFLVTCDSTDSPKTILCYSVDVTGETDIAMYSATIQEQDATRIQRKFAMAAPTSIPGYLCMHGGESWWTCPLDPNEISTFILSFSRSDDVEQTRQIGVDDVQILPILSNYTTQLTATEARTMLVIPTQDELHEAGVAGAFREPPLDTAGWRRLHVLVGIFSQPAIDYKLDVRVDVNGVVGVGRTGCVADPHMLHPREVVSVKGYAACGLEIPLDILTPDIDIVVTPPHSAITRIDVSIPPHMSLLECAWDEYFDIDFDTCKSCGGICETGKYRSSCQALTGISECKDCAALTEPQTMLFENDCSWRCIEQYWRDDTTCQECSKPACGMGEYRSRCLSDADSDCVLCANQTHAHYDVAGTCDQVCDTGYFRSQRAMCEVCSTMSMLRAGIEFIDRTPGMFFRIHPCTAVSDAFYEVCSHPDNGTYVGDGTQWSMDCVLQCPPGYRLVTQNRQMVSTNTMPAPLNQREQLVDSTIEWRANECVPCPVPTGPDDTALPDGSFSMDNSCTLSCIAPFQKRGAKCVRCREDLCGIGKYLTGALCQTCESCVSTQTDENFRFVSRGKLDANASCKEQCQDDMFDEYGLGKCKNYSTLVCQNYQYFQAGTATEDNKCRNCSSCEGQLLVRACGHRNNTVCKTCGEPETGAMWTGTTCDRECKSGYVMDHRTHTCELCTFTCPPGHETASNRQNCTHCQKCTQPNISHWEWVQHCEWACSIGFEMRDGTCQPHSSNQAQPIPSSLRVRCPLGTKPDGLFDCVACDSAATTPPESQNGVTWMWLETGTPCEWTCMMPLVKHTVSLSVSCIRWETYRRATTVDAAVVRVTGLQNPATILNTLNRWEVYVASGCLLILVIVIVTVKVH